MEIFQQVFAGATAAELAAATAPLVMQLQPGQSKRANVIRPKGWYPCTVRSQSFCASWCILGTLAD